MQIYLSGITPLFWRQISALPSGVYNKENNQTTSARIPQLLVSFVNRPIGTVLNVLINGTKIAEAKVLDNTGFAYARIPLPYTKAQDSIDIQLRDTSGVVVSSESFATSNISFLFETQASSYAGIDGSVHGVQRVLEDSQQIQEDDSIVGVDALLLENKFGIYTGLRRRTDQTVNTYRSQTSCLWKAFQFAGTERGLADAVSCVLGIMGPITQIAITPTKSVQANLIFNLPQFDSADHFNPASPITRIDPDTPHYYVADKTADYRTTYTISDPDPITMLDPSTNPSDNFNLDNVRSFTIHTIQAIGNESVVELIPTTQVGVSEDVASVNIDEESVLCRTSNTDAQPIRDSNPDKLANGFISSKVKISEATIGGILTTNLTLLPVQDVDFTVSILSGEMTWLGTSKQPDKNTLYKASYSFRLDTQLQIVIKKIKPAGRKVVIVFSNVFSGLPNSVIA